MVGSIGAMVTIVVVYVLSDRVAGGAGAAVLVPSMGATAVLVFTAPASPLSQPWSVLGGHVVSALVGVGCVRIFPQRELAAAAAVGGALVAMQLLRCLHPPGGATALAAVIAGPSVTALGWGYVLRPVALDAVLLLVVATAVHAGLTRQRYPALHRIGSSVVTVGEHRRPQVAPTGGIVPLVVPPSPGPLSAAVLAALDEVYAAHEHLPTPPRRPARPR